MNASIALSVSVLAVALFGSTTASAEDLPAPPWPATVVLGPEEVVWLPPPKGYCCFYPERAQRAGMPGEALIECIADADGALNGCRILMEKPAGAGFGHSALELYRRMKVKPLTRDGRPVARAHIEIPMHFKLAH